MNGVKDLPPRLPDRARFTVITTRPAYGLKFFERIFKKVRHALLMPSRQRGILPTRIRMPTFERGPNGLSSSPDPGMAASFTCRQLIYRAVCIELTARYPAGSPGWWPRYGAASPLILQ